MKNVKTLIVVALMGASLFASTTRTEALGGAGFWAEDYANVTTFPADVNNHNVAWTNGENFTSIFNANGTTWGFTGGTDDEVVNMMWGNGNMGVTFGLSMDPTEAVASTMTCGDGGDEACDDAVAAGETDFAIGFGMPLAGMDFGFTYDGDNMGVNLRRAQNVWLWDTMLINFGMAMEDLDAGNAAGMSFGASCYSNTSYDSGTNGLFALSFGFSDAGINPYDHDMDASTANVSTDTNDCGSGTESCDPAATIGINWDFAVESAMTDWATLRVGYSHGYNFAGDADVTGGVGGGADGFTIGLGFNYGSFNLDMALTNGMMFNDPVKYMTGRNADPLGAAWTISYAW